MTEPIALPPSISKSKQGQTEFVTSDFGHVYVPSRVLYKGSTGLQEIEVYETDTFGRIMFLDGKIQVSYLDEERYHQYLVQGPLLACENPKSIYIIGGGDGGAIEEAAKHPGIERIVMAEIDQVVIDKSKEYLPEISRGAFDDKRLDLRCVDALKDLQEDKNRYDVIIVDLTEPHGPSKMLYTKEFYQLLASRLTEGGMVGVHTDNFDLFPESYGTIYNTLKSAFGANILTAHVGMPCFGMAWSYRIVSPYRINFERIEKNFRAAVQRGMQLDYFHPSTYLAQPTARERAVIEKFNRVSTNASPYDKFEQAATYITGKI
ncbi:fused MFS/spermidine synthase [Candidatus Manganitrophus noduliformans]|nr:fused MFS/spermidine synthase [Candidatus Manganitrophus noduliformans]